MFSMKSKFQLEKELLDQNFGTTNSQITIFKSTDLNLNQDITKYPLNEEYYYISSDIFDISSEY